MLKKQQCKNRRKVIQVILPALYKHTEKRLSEMFGGYDKRIREELGNDIVDYICSEFKINKKR